MQRVGSEGLRAEGMSPHYSPQMALRAAQGCILLPWDTNPSGRATGTFCSACTRGTRIMVCVLAAALMCEVSVKSRSWEFKANLLEWGDSLRVQEASAVV